jgi:hypothetical protein
MVELWKGARVQITLEVDDFYVYEGSSGAVPVQWISDIEPLCVDGVVAVVAGYLGRSFGAG